MRCMQSNHCALASIALIAAETKHLPALPKTGYLLYKARPSGLGVQLFVYETTAQEKSIGTSIFNLRK